MRLLMIEVLPEDIRWIGSLPNLPGTAHEMLNLILVLKVLLKSVEVFAETADVLMLFKKDESVAHILFLEQLKLVL